MRDISNKSSIDEQWSFLVQIASITKEEFYSNKHDTYYSKNSVLAINLNRFLDEAH